MLNKEIIISYLESKKDKWVKSLGLTELGLFGSFARDEQDQDQESCSDIDIVFDFHENNINKKRFIKQNIKDHFDRDVNCCPLDYLERRFPENIAKIKRELIFVLKNR